MGLMARKYHAPARRFNRAQGARMKFPVVGQFEIRGSELQLRQLRMIFLSLPAGWGMGFDPPPQPTGWGRLGLSEMKLLPPIANPLDRTRADKRK